MLRRIPFNALFPVESTTAGIAGSAWIGTSVAGIAPGAASISGEERATAVSLTTGTLGSTAGLVFVVTGGLLLGVVRPGTGIDWKPGITAATVRGLSSSMASIGAMISFRGVCKVVARSEEELAAPEATR